MKRVIRMGLTGGIAAGKSAVATLLKERFQIPVLDADQVAREVVSPGSEGLERVMARFGPRSLQPDGTLDRTWLGSQISADPVSRRDLEAILHPLILARSEAWLQAQQSHAAAIEAALLVESGWYRAFDEILLVRSAIETRIERLRRTRGMPPEAARLWLASQISDEARIPHATLVIDNDGTPEDLAECLARGLASRGLLASRDVGTTPDQ